jgi:hypothetical protein
MENGDIFPRMGCRSSPAVIVDACISCKSFVTPEDSRFAPFEIGVPQLPNGDAPMSWSEPPFVRVERSQSSGDCALVALAMLTGKSYGDVLDAAASVAKCSHRRGLYVTQIMRTAQALGVPLRKKKHIDFDNDVGIGLFHCAAYPDVVTKRPGAVGHAALVRWGLIFDGDEVWEDTLFSSHYQATATGILVRR